MTLEEQAEALLIHLCGRAATEGSGTHFFLPGPARIPVVTDVHGAAKLMEQRGWVTLTYDHNNDTVVRLTTAGLTAAAGLTP